VPALKSGRAPRASSLRTESLEAMKCSSKQMARAVSLLLSAAKPL
jgi:hypothetical protein